jgi:hypothetical protein
MRRSAAALLALGAVVVLAGCGGSSGTQFKAQTLTFDEKDTNVFGFVDAPPMTKTGPQGPEKVSNGDEVTFRSDLIDSSGADVGDLDATCTFTDAGSDGKFESSHTVCTGVATVPGGSLTLNVGGKAFASNTTNGAVTGGTGDYAGATGSFVSAGSDNGPNHDTFTIYVPQP